MVDERHHHRDAAVGVGGGRSDERQGGVSQHHYVVLGMSEFDCVEGGHHACGNGTGDGGVDDISCLGWIAAAGKISAQMELGRMCWHANSLGHHPCVTLGQVQEALPVDVGVERITVQRDIPVVSFCGFVEIWHVTTTALDHHESGG